jgi:Ca-activated chloride channel family protein
MSRRRTSFGILAAGLALVGLAGLAVPQPATAMQTGGEVQAHVTQLDTSEFPWVTAYVSVTDAQGAPVAIDPARLEIVEDGQGIEPERIEGLGPVESLSAMLVFDVSGSMNQGGKLEEAKRAARAFIEMMRPTDRVGLIAFDVEVHRIAPLTSDQTVLHPAIDGLGGVRDTALYDAVLAAVQDLRAAAGRRAVVVLSDGMDNSSAHTLEDVLGEIGPAGLSIYTVGLGDPQEPAGSMARLDVPALETLAERTGGDYAFASSESLLTLFESLAQRLQSEYALRYESPRALRDGLMREISIQIREAPSSSAAEVRYNPGGLVPEVEAPAPWPVFLGAMLGLVALLLVPAAVGRALARVRSRQSPQPSRSRVRLQDAPQREPRIRLH